MSRYAIINGGKVINTAVADTPQGADWVQSDTAQIGDSYDGAQFSTPASRPRVVITGLAVDSVAKALANRVIIEVGEVLDVTVRFEMGGQLLPVNDSFAVPISKVREGVEQTKRANFVDGVATMSVTFERSGEFAVLPEWLNLHLPADQQVEFEPFYISVTG